jgi:hypothetical protein
MIDLVDFAWVFPTLGSLGVWCTFLAAGIVYSFLVNNQEAINKRRNMAKYAMAVSFFATVTVVSQLLNNETNAYPRTVTIAILVWIFLVAGDWISYGLRRWHTHPGGVQGWFWKSLLDISRRVTAHAITQYAEIIDPAEAKMLEMAIDAIDPKLAKTADVIASKTADVVVPKVAEVIVAHVAPSKRLRT